MQKDRGYFKGWYFKCETGDQTVAFIPSLHQTGGEETALLQIITDSGAYAVPFAHIEYREKPLRVRIGNCRFSEKGITLNLDADGVSLHGALQFRALSPLRSDIMGPFAFVPFMQCRHSVYSMAHRIDGLIVLNGKEYRFQNGTGYIEGDRGYSFPSQYLWTQCRFETGSLMLSVADIPFCGFHFTGVIGAVLRNGKEYRIATYLGAKPVRIGNRSVTVRQGDYVLTARLLSPQGQPLFAPVNGAMNRTIHESAACRAAYRFSFRDTVLCEFVSDRACFEFEYPRVRNKDTRKTPIPVPQTAPEPNLRTNTSSRTFPRNRIL